MERKGKMGKKKGLGPGGFCKCPECGYKIEHQAESPCRDLKCPQCDVVLVREGSDEDK
jgi:hypothetical protein